MDLAEKTVVSIKTTVFSWYAGGTRLLFCFRRNNCRHQFLNWCQQYATGILRLNLSSPFRTECEIKEEIPTGYLLFYLGKVVFNDTIAPHLTRFGPNLHPTWGHFRRFCTPPGPFFDKFAPHLLTRVASPYHGYETPSSKSVANISLPPSRNA